MPVTPSRAKGALADRHDPEGLAAYVMRYLEWLRVHNYSACTVENREACLGYFVAWCLERGLGQPKEITKPILERYQRSLYHWRKRNGEPLSFRAQHTRLVPVRAFFRWLTRQNYLLCNPASELELPRLERRLPKHVLTITEVEQVMRIPKLDTPQGIRDRAILETLYSTGMRRRELIGLALYDIDRERGTVMIRLGKGKKDRMIPIGERALTWINRYQNEVRPELVVGRDPAHLATLFLTHRGGGVHAEPAHPARARVRASRPARQKRLVSPVPPHHGDVDVGERRRHPLHPGDARARRALDHADLHPGLDPKAQGDPHRHAPGQGAIDTQDRS